MQLFWYIVQLPIKTLWLPSWRCGCLNPPSATPRLPKDYFVLFSEPTVFIATATVFHSLPESVTVCHSLPQPATARHSPPQSATVCHSLPQPATFATVCHSLPLCHSPPQPATHCFFSVSSVWCLYIMLPPRILWHVLFPWFGLFQSEHRGSLGLFIFISRIKWV